MKKVDFIKFRSNMHGVNEKLGRGRDGKLECSLCGIECESMNCVVGVFRINIVELK